MLKKIILGLMVIALLSLLGTCGLYFWHEKHSENPGKEVAPWEILIVDEKDNIVSLFYAKEAILQNDGCWVLDNFWVSVGDKWEFHNERPLFITPEWGNIKVRRR